MLNPQVSMWLACRLLNLISVVFAALTDVMRLQRFRKGQGAVRERDFNAGIIQGSFYGCQNIFA
jgi:hypothetical protein